MRTCRNLSFLLAAPFALRQTVCHKTTPLACKGVARDKTRTTWRTLLMLHSFKSMSTRLQFKLQYILRFNYAFVSVIANILDLIASNLSNEFSRLTTKLDSSYSKSCEGQFLYTNKKQGPCTGSCWQTSRSVFRTRLLIRRKRFAQPVRPREQLLDWFHWEVKSFIWVHTFTEYLRNLLFPSDKRFDVVRPKRQRYKLGRQKRCILLLLFWLLLFSCLNLINSTWSQNIFSFRNVYTVIS